MNSWIYLLLLVSQYANLNRFSKAINQQWPKGSTDLEGLIYTYTRTNNQTEQRNEVVPLGKDESCGYDTFGESRVMDANFGARSHSFYDWEIRYKGYFFDHETDLYQVRYHYLHSTLGRWMSRRLFNSE